MAREILGLEHGDPRQSEHKNRKPLDNRETNLRIAENGDADNQQNVGIRVDNQSGYRGVSRRGRKWSAQVGLGGKKNYLGSYDTPEEAHSVVSAFRAEHMPFSEDARVAQGIDPNETITEES